VPGEVSRYVGLMKHEKLVESREPDCPYCHAEKIKFLGRFQAVNGVVQSERQCIMCGQTFVYARRPLGRVPSGPHGG
jgi:hypothetical protein